jgi:alpha-tubulin suppressor-like RCC1 family protein
MHTLTHTYICTHSHIHTYAHTHTPTPKHCSLLPVYTFGCDDFNQLGRTGSIGKTTDCKEPGVVSGELEGVRVVDVDCGDDHTIALADDGRLFSWGRGSEGQHGQACVSMFMSPHVVPLPGAVRMARCGSNFVVVALLDGSLYTWGSASSGCMARESSSSKPGRVIALAHTFVVTVACGACHVICTTSTGDMYCWGHNEVDQLPLPPSVYSLVSQPQLVALSLFGGERVLDYKLSYRQSCFRTHSGLLYMAGSNNYGQQGDALQGRHTALHLVPLDGRVTHAVNGCHHTFIVQQADTVLREDIAEHLWRVGVVGGCVCVFFF